MFMNTTANNTARPPKVALVVVFLAISFGVSLFRYIVAEQSYDFRFYFVLTLMLLLEGTIVWFILRGKNWARWALLAVFVLGVVSSWPDFLQRVHDYSAS